MVRQLLLVLILYSLLGCDTGIDKALIGDIEKLKSPNNEFVLYRYFIESSMAFGEGMTVIKILPTEESVDFTDRDFLRFGNDYPFWIKWKTKDTLLVRCLTDGAGLQDKQPFRKEIQKWKEWTFEVEYYSMFSTSLGGDYNCDNYKVDSDKISFSSDEKSWSFKTEEVNISIDSNNISLTHIRVDTFQTKLGLSFTSYNFKNHYFESDFLKQQVFIKVHE